MTNTFSLGPVAQQGASLALVAADAIVRLFAGAWLLYAAGLPA